MSVITEASENDENKMSEFHSDHCSAEDAAAWLLSGIYCMLIVILSMVLCSTHYITTDVTDITVDVYFIFLCMVGSTWLIGFEPIVTSCSKKPDFLEIKSQHTTNRWLKGILVLFGLAIIIKDTLEFLATFQYTDENCKKPVYFIAPLAQIIFIITEVNFLFKFSKVHLQNFKRSNMFGVMHVIATNLSIWMLVIIDEAMEGVVTVAHSQRPPGKPLTTAVVPTAFTEAQIDAIEGCNMTLVHEMLQNSVDTNTQTEEEWPQEPFAPDNCYCNTSYCTAVSSAHSFLYPFLVEFSLVSSCMMYIVWKNIGSLPHIDGHPVVKPSYKFYKSYKSTLAGGFIVTLTVVILVLINNSHTNLPELERNYESDKQVLILFNGYEVMLEIIMVIVCVVGFALFRAEPRPVKAEANLDVVLLLVTIVGCLVLDVYYAFAVYTSMISDAYSYSWIWGAVYPIVDIVQCVVQVGFIMVGLSRQPVLETSYYEKVKRILRKSNENRISECIYTNDGFVQDNKIVIEIPSDDLNNEDKTSSSSYTESGSEETKFSYAMDREKTICGDLSVTTDVNETGFTGEQIHAIINESDNNPENTDKIKQHKIAYPSPTRLRIRETVMFLLIANACMWTFWSLEGTSFKLSSYPYQYYARDNSSMRNTWHSVAMICLPLSIFFRMHSCACLFEVWSLT